MLRSRRSGLALGLLLGAALDPVLADPRRAHPVAAFGRSAAALEGRIWADTRARGVLFSAACAGSVVVLGVAVQRRANGHPVSLVTVTALATWTVLGGTSLAAEGAAMARLIEAGDLAAARRRLRVLCGRDAAGLDAAGLAPRAIRLSRLTGAAAAILAAAIAMLAGGRASGERATGPRSAGTAMAPVPRSCR